MKGLPEIRERLERKAQAFRRLFSTPDGKEVLDILKDEFAEGDLFDVDPCVTAYRLGARDMVVYINQLMRYDNAKS